MAVLARSYRRAGLRVRMSEGFNPRPRFSLPAPLSLGIEGLSEVLELDMAEPIDPKELQQKLSEQMPRGIQITSAEQLPDGEKARVASVTYNILGKVDAAPATVNRDGGEFDMASYISRTTPIEGGCECEVVVTSAGTARPSELALAFAGVDQQRASQFQLVRTSVNLASP